MGPKLVFLKYGSKFFFRVLLQVGSVFSGLPDWSKGLPVAIIAQVAGGKNELKAMREVSKGWLRGFESSVSAVKIGSRGPTLPPSRTFQERFPALTSLDLGWCLMENSGLSSLAGHKTLASLNLGFLSADPCGGAAAEAGAGGIVKAGVGAAPESGAGGMLITGAGAVPGAGAGGIVKSGAGAVPEAGAGGMLKVGVGAASEAAAVRKPLFRKLTEAGLRHLRGLPLTKLDLLCCAQMSDMGLQHLRDIPLASLNLGWCRQISDLGLEALKDMPLTKLDLRGCKYVTDVGLGYLRGMPVGSLNLRGCCQLTDASLAVLREMPLTKLCLQECFLITQEGLMILRRRYSLV